MAFFFSGTPGYKACSGANGWDHLISIIYVFNSFRPCENDKPKLDKKHLHFFTLIEVEPSKYLLLFPIPAITTSLARWELAIDTIKVDFEHGTSEILTKVVSSPQL
ncbi:hypothetical protein VNO78_34265 [Psophocarpus tetragonolobus]|uniref:Uncharacterized protein n=1 Tax=Psophocarpus tetragonolobus TaxID=3891 RepID=A0AAN9NZ42_PSOTE